MAEGIAGDVDRESLWRLLKTFTVRKVGRQIERDDAAKRGGGKVICEADLARDGSNAGNLDEAFGKLATPDFDLACEELLAKLPDEELRVVAPRQTDGGNKQRSGRAGRLLGTADRTQAPVDPARLGR